MKVKQRIAMRIVITLVLFLGSFLVAALIFQRIDRPETERIETELTVLSVVVRQDQHAGAYITTEEHGPHTKIRIPPETKLVPGQKYKFVAWRNKATGELIWAVRATGG